ncbi:MAG: ATP-grasp domain-containing protein [Actinomycetota bacterium]
MRNIVIICPTIRDFREIEKVNTEEKYNHNYIFYGKNLRENLGTFDPVKFIEKFQKDFRHMKVDGIIATHDYPASIIASILTEKLGIPGVRTFLNLLCQHKYYSRIYQSKVVPDGVPVFFLVNPSGNNSSRPPYFPIFLKPVKSFFSIFASRIDNVEQYKRYVKLFLDHNRKFVKPLNILLKKYSDFKINADYLIAENLLAGQQATLEGYVFEGKIKVLGITDSIMYPGTISFKRFEYPSSLPSNIKERMSEIARNFISFIKFNNGMFNIEFFYNFYDNTVKIIEVNPRMASQFADLMEKVEGTNTYKIQIDISLGRKPDFKKRGGNFEYATSFVLRSFKDKKIIKLPKREDLEKVLSLFPDARVEIYGKVGTQLSEYLQDMQSYRYAVISLGGNSRQDLDKKFNQCTRMLKFNFMDID